MISFPRASAYRWMCAPRPTKRRTLRRSITAGLEPLETRTVLSPYTMPLVNDSLLNPERFSIYVDGFSTGSGLTLQPGGGSGVLNFAAQTGTVSSFKLGKGSGEYHEIQFDSSQSIVGARVYLFVVPKGQSAPSFEFNNPQPANPPGYKYLYTYIELTEPLNGKPTINISTVDGFTIPATLSLNSNLGQVGQPLAGQSSKVNRQAIITEFKKFMSAAGREIYKPLELPAKPSADGQSEGLLNPSLYLEQKTGNNALPENVRSPLNTVFNGALAALFSTSNWSLQGTDSNVYTATAGTYQYASQTNPYTRQPVMLPGLKFTGGGNTYYVFNPVGVNNFVGENGKAIIANSVSGQLNQIKLTNAPASGVLQKGMYVFGTYFNQSNAAATNYITNVDVSGGTTVITLHDKLPFAVTNDQVVFGQLPYLSILQDTSGEMVFGGAGFFADAVQQGLTGLPQQTMSNLENQIDSALNRGVAVVGGASGPLKPSTNGYASEYWGTETNWYPAGQPQNIFSLFLHIAVLDKEPIFVRPPNPAKDNNGNLMGSAYGFSFDENPGPVPPAPANQPEVPSKFDPVPDGTTTITITVDPWTGASRNVRARA